MNDKVNGTEEVDKATILDLIWSVRLVDFMFGGSKVISGYARTTADANKFNATSSKPSGLTFVVK